jgi:hypothetical protein
MRIYGIQLILLHHVTYKKIYIYYLSADINETILYTPQTRKAVEELDAKKHFRRQKKPFKNTKI